jgi:hypothetical protein
MEAESLKNQSIVQRWVLSRYPAADSTIIQESLATFGLRVLLQQHRLENLLHSTASVVDATESARTELLSIIRRHIRSEKKKQRVSTAKVRPALHQPPAPRGRTHTSVTHPVDDAPARVVGKSREPRPDVLAKYPFVDGQGHVGAVLAGSPPSTAFHRLAKREIKRLAGRTFTEFRASTLGIRCVLSSMPSQYESVIICASCDLHIFDMWCCSNMWQFLYALLVIDRRVCCGMRCNVRPKY